MNDRSPCLGDTNPTRIGYSFAASQKPPPQEWPLEYKIVCSSRPIVAIALSESEDAACDQMINPYYIDLSRFSAPAAYRGRSAFIVQLWWLIQDWLIRPSPQFLFGWRRFLWRLFGAQVGAHVLIRPTARVTYPWKVKVGARSWIGDRAELYSLA
ncbi:MAG: hypothetical protein WAW96_02765, partial [Alphaproteobacteria bacterium]